MLNFSRKIERFRTLAAVGLLALFLTHCGTLDMAMYKGQAKVNWAKSKMDHARITAKVNTDIFKGKLNAAIRKTKAGAGALKDAMDPTTAKARIDFDYGKSQYNAKNYETARYYFKKTLLTIPDYLPALNLLAWSNFFQRRYDKALPAFYQAHALYPREPSPVMGAAWSYLAVKNYEKALETFDKAEKLSGDSYQIHKGRGFTYLKMKRPDDARQEFSQIFTSRQIDRLLADWREWKAGDPDSLLDVASADAESPSLFILPVEKPRYPGAVLARQVAAPSEGTDRAWDTFKRGAYSKAIKQFKKQGHSLDAANGLAWAYLRHDRMIQAEKLFRKILKRYPDFQGSSEGLEELEKVKRGKTVHAKYYYDLKKHNLALLEYQKLTEKYPDWPYPYAHSGQVYFKKSRYGYAQAHYQKALGLDPENQTARKGLAEVYRKTVPLLLQANEEREKGNFESASWLYAEFIEEQNDPFFEPVTLGEAYNGLGWSYFEKKQFHIATRNFKKAEKFKEFESSAVKGLGLSYYSIGDFKKAAEYLKTAHKTKPDQKEITYKLDWSILQSAGMTRAEELFKDVLKKDPLRASSYMGMGWINYKRKKPNLAIEYFMKAVSIDPDFAWTQEFRRLLNQERFGWQVYNQFGWAYYHNARYEKSLDLFLISRERQPNKSETLKGIGYNLFQQEKYREAIEMFRQSLTLNTKPRPVVEMVSDENAIAPFEIRTSIHTKLGWSLFHLGKYTQAVSQFNRALQIHPAWSDVHDGLGWAYLKLNRLSEARAAFNLAIKDQPLNHSAHKGLNQVKQTLAAKRL